MKYSISVLDTIMESGHSQHWSIEYWPYFENMRTYIYIYIYIMRPVEKAIQNSNLRKGKRYSKKIEIW